ncbi:hypothetical protein [Rhodococcus sp. NPDC055024]
MVGKPLLSDQVRNANSFPFLRVKAAPEEQSCVAETDVECHRIDMVLGDRGEPAFATEAELE